MILSGQRFYATESEMRRKGTTHTSGVIKVGDAAFGWGNAEVCNAPGEEDAFYVNAINTEYHTLDWAKKMKWKLP